MSQRHRILVCLRYGIGDAMMEIPALRSLRAAWPDAELWLLGARPALELFEGDPDFQNLVCVHDFGFQHWGDLGDDTARQEFQRWFRNSDFDCVLDPFHAVFGIQNALTHSGVAWRNSSPRPRVPERLEGGHGIAAIWRSAVDKWGLDPRPHSGPPPQSLFIPANAERAAGQRLLDWFGGSDPDRPVVGLVPLASSELKRWPVERLAEVVRWLTGKQQCRVLIFGAAADSPLLPPLRRAAPKNALLALAPTHLQETAALAARCDAFVSNDTGLMHLAAAVGTPTVGIFGPTAAHIYLPGSSLAVSSERACEYRLQEHFGPPQCVHAAHCLIAPESCIRTIPTAAVTAALEKLLWPDAGWTETSWPSCGSGSVGLEQ